MIATVTSREKYHYLLDNYSYGVIGFEDVFLEVPSLSPVSTIYNVFAIAPTHRWLLTDLPRVVKSNGIQR